LRSKRLEHDVARPDAALDAGGGELVELEAVAQHFEKARLLWLYLEVRGGDFERDRISRLAELLRQRALDQNKDAVEPAILAQDAAASLGGLDQPFLVEIGEDGQVGDDFADAGELGVGHGPVHGRHGDHHIDEGGVMVQRLGHGGASLSLAEARSGATVGNCDNRGKRRNPFPLRMLLASPATEIVETLAPVRKL
jgi:hypothetical protein